MLTRKLSLILLVVVALYALAGFVALPWWLEREIPDRLQQHLGWQASIEEVRVNPFAMSIEAIALAAEDSEGESVAGLDRLYINLGVWRLVTGVVAFQAVELDEPFVRLDLLENYGLNLARDWRAHNPAGDETDASGPGEDSGGPPRVFFDRIRLAGGELLFRDFTKAEMESFPVTPLDLTLNDLATWPREDEASDYYLMAAIGEQTIEWQGDLSLVPLQSSGSLTIADVSYRTVGHFAGPYLPYSLRQGQLTVSSDYQLQVGDALSLSTSGGRATLTDLAIGLPGDADTELLRAGRIEVPDIAFGLNAREVSVGEIALEQLSLSLTRNEQGQLNVLQPLADQSDSAPAPESHEVGAGQQADPFGWSLAGITLSNSRVDWRDRQPVADVDLAVTGLGVELGRLSDQLGDPVDYRTELELESGGRLTGQGQLTLQPFTLESAISLSNLALGQFDAYVREATNLALQEGVLGVDGELALDNQSSPLTGTFNGTAELSGLDLRLEDTGEPILGWQSLRLEPLEYNLSPARLEIGTVTLSDPTVNVIREADGSHNLDRIMAATGSERSAGEASGQTEDGSGAEEKGLIFRIGQILLEEGTVEYADRTLQPAFATRMDQLNGSVTGLSNVPPQQGKISMSGRLGDVGSLKFDGAIGTLGTEDASDLKLNVSGVSLPALSPYFGRFLGYSVASGKLDLNLDYQVSGSTINADNRVVMDQMKLGDRVDSQDAVNAPIKLGLALLRDSDGVIHIDLPIEGDLDSPDFRIGRVVTRAFVNLIVKAASSPFGMLGSLADAAGLTGEDLGQVSFAPGQVAAVESEREELGVLAEALEERPSLLLKLRGAVAADIDGDFLKRQRLFSELDMDQAPSAEARVRKLEAYYQVQDLEPSLDELRAELAESQEGEPGRSVWEAALVNRLVDATELAPEVLSELATARGVWLRDTLTSELDVSGDQLFLLEPERDAETDEQGNVVARFELEAR